MHAVPEGHQHAVCWGADGGRGGGALEPPQTHRAQSAAAGRRPTRPVSHLISCTVLNYDVCLSCKQGL